MGNGDWQKRSAPPPPVCQSPVPNPQSLPSMFQALRPILNKGGAGYYATRAESAERVMPVAQRHIDLYEDYRGALAGLAPGAARSRVEAFMPLYRTEVAKMSETLLSYGAAPPNGVGREPSDLGATDAERLLTLTDRERDFGNALRAEVDAVHHQERTRAILEHNARASDQRLDVLRDLTSGLRRA